MSFNAGVPDWKQRLAVELKRDRKKTAVLAVLFVAAGVMGGRAIVHGLPDSSAAADLDAPAGAAAAIVAPRDGGAKPPAADGAERKLLVLGERKITRDIFQAKLDFYPLEAPVAEVKSDTRPAEDPELLEAQSIRARAKGLKLESTVTSGTPTAIINGKMFRVGEWISNFQVVQIDARSCVIQPQKGPRITLVMAGE